MGVKLDELVMALPRVSIPFNLGPEGFKYHVADGSQTLVTLSGILTHMQRHDEELKAQRERADKAEATVKKLGDELRQLGVKQALLLERADRVELSADKEAVRNTNAHRGAEVRIDALATEAEADRKKTSDLDAALAEVGKRAEKLEHRASTMSARLDAAAGTAPGPSSWKDDVDDVDDVVETVMALQGEVARIGAAVAVTNNLMDRTANEIMMRFPYKDEVAAMHQLAEADVPESLEDVASGVDLSLAPAAAPGAAPAPAPQGSDGESVFGVDDFLDGFGEAPAPSPFEATPPTVSAKAVTQMERSATELEKSLEYLMLRMPAPNTIAFDGKPVGLPPYAEKKLAWVVSEVKKLGGSPSKWGARRSTTTTTTRDGDSLAEDDKERKSLKKRLAKVERAVRKLVDRAPGDASSFASDAMSLGSAETGEDQADQARAQSDGGPMGAVAEGDEAAGDTVDADVVHALREDLANVKEHCEEEIAQLNLKVQAVEMDATGRSDDVPDRAAAPRSEKGLASVVALTDGMAFRLDDAEAKLGERGDAAADGEAVEKLGARAGVGERSSSAVARARRLDDGITLDAALERAADDSPAGPHPRVAAARTPLDDDALHDASGSVADPWGDEPEGDDFAKPGDGSPLNMANPPLDATDGSTFPNPYPSHHDATPGASRPATVGGDARRPASQGDFALPELSHRDEAAARAKLDALKGKIEGIALQQPPPPRAGGPRPPPAPGRAPGRGGPSRELVDQAFLRFHAEADSAAEWLDRLPRDQAAAQRLDIKAKLANELRLLLETVQDPEGAAGRDGFPPLVDDDWGGEPTLASTRPICLSCRRPTSQHGAQRGGRVLSAHRQFAAQTFQPPDDTVVWRAGFKMPFANQFYQVDRPRSPPVADHSVFSASRSISVSDPAHPQQPQRPVLRNQTPESWIKEKRKNQHHRSQ
ncbi:hypothetical protein SO694_0007019 [Aureococcus anophagefferens]|uniref:Uncharacterized protein n=2 Tax=Aureococcus anophagefferens TaxID=44056 RepID=A0ABR1FZQ9_AURAN